MLLFIDGKIKLKVFEVRQSKIEKYNYTNELNSFYYNKKANGGR